MSCTITGKDQVEEITRGVRLLSARQNNGGKTRRTSQEEEPL
jgi:hypothetical protein